MGEKIINISLQVMGMTCASCELKIENTLQKKNGVLGAKADMAASLVHITMDDNKLQIKDVIAAIEKLGYKAFEKDSSKTSVRGPSIKEQKNKKMDISQLLGLAVIITALYVIINNTIGFNFIPEINQSMGYGILFLVGLLTSIHCIGMCGGICLSQCIKADHGESTTFEGMKPSLLYNSGRVVSYTVIGGVVGGLGRVISFSGSAQGVVAIVAGTFMIIMGINMLNIFPFLKKFNIRLPRYFGNKIYNSNGKYSPFYIGLLNGFMPCGPLQSMQLYALGTGSVATGAISMLMFSLGTVPLMFIFGTLSSVFSKRFTKGLMKASAVLVMFLGFIMLSRGMSLSGITAVSSPVKGNIATIANGVQTVSIDLEPNRYESIVVQQGIPVRFTINVKEENLNGCNNAIVISKYGVKKRLVPGENIIEFTPDKEGDVPYSCWMGMIRSNIKVVSDVSQVSSSGKARIGIDSINTAAIGGCCGGGGSNLTQQAVTSSAVDAATTDTEDVYILSPDTKVQTVKVTVSDSSFSPSVIILQKNTTVRFKFEMETENQGVVDFPEYRGQLDLAAGDLETPELDMFTDFGFVIGSRSFYSYVKVVEDIKDINLETIKLEAANYMNGQSAAAGCH